MASLKLEHIYKVYPNGTKAVNDFTMNIDDQEFIVFVGPSGCGKSTTLRMIAGLEEISAGELYIGDQIVNDVEPKDRDIAMVFQNYALYPHMTVYENMAFGLTLRHVPRNIIHEKVLWAAEILGLKEYLDRKPKAMSGGQRQRVSLGRAILRNPKVMLLDEPLSNLDAKLRSQMRSEISKLHQSLKTTFIYVTHDQVEAMTLGTRVVVMKLGRIQQIDTPKNLYDYPENKFVAGFIGTPQMNFFDVTLKRDKDKVAIAFVDEDVDNQVIHIPFSEMLKVHKYYMNGDRVVTMGVRCEDLSIEPEDVKDGKNLIDMRITHFEELGNETLVYGDLSMKEKGIMDSPTKIIVKASSKLGHKSGDIVKVHVNVLKAHFFDHETELSISSRLPKTNIFAINVNKGKIHILGHDLTLPAAIKEALPETYKGSIDLPVRSVKVGEGELEATITRLERINDLTLAYLVIGEHTFFALVDDKQKVGDKVKVFLDLKDASFSNLDGEALAPLKERDELIANFINFRTAIANVNEGSNKGEYNETAKKFIAERDHRIEVITKQYDEKIAARPARAFSLAVCAARTGELSGLQGIHHADVCPASGQEGLPLGLYRHPLAISLGGHTLVRHVHHLHPGLPVPLPAGPDGAGGASQGLFARHGHAALGTHDHRLQPQPYGLPAVAAGQDRAARDGHRRVHALPPALSHRDQRRRPVPLGEGPGQACRAAAGQPPQDLGRSAGRHRHHRGGGRAAGSAVQPAHAAPRPWGGTAHRHLRLFGRCRHERRQAGRGRQGFRHAPAWSWRHP